MKKEFIWNSPELLHDLDQNGLPVGKPVVDWSACSAPPRTPMQGQYCRLDPFVSEAHAPQLYEAFVENANGANWAYLPYGPFATFEAFRQWCETACGHDDPMFHTITDTTSSKSVGLASYLRITPDNGVIEVGHIHFSPLMQGTRTATESMFLMMQRVFDELGYRRYEWKCDALNAPSVRAAQRFGFQFEGIFRQATMYKGRNRDTAWFAITDSDWPRLREGYQAWLSAGNFDQSGRQHQSLSTFFQS